MRFFWKSKAQVEGNELIEHNQEGECAQEELCEGSIETLEATHAAFAHEKSNEKEGKGAKHNVGRVSKTVGHPNCRKTEAGDGLQHLASEWLLLPEHFVLELHYIVVFQLYMTSNYRPDLT